MPERKRKMQGVYDWHRSALKVCHGRSGKVRVILAGQRVLHPLPQELPNQVPPPAHFTRQSPES